MKTKEFNKLKRIRDLCSHESLLFGRSPNYIRNFGYYRQGRAEFAQSILELIGETMNKKLGDVEEDYQSIFNEEEDCDEYQRLLDDGTLVEETNE
tara:strand:+ start:336 stop:620 length:285 start_codon:yes stop_codon:yes gene_type:complete